MGKRIVNSSGGKIPAIILEGIIRDNIRQYYDPDDNCIYFYDEIKRCYRKVCDISSFSDLPYKIKLQIKADKELSKKIMLFPVE